MDKELKEHLNRIEKRFDGMATKSDLADIRNEMATKSDISKLDTRIDGIEKNMATKSDIERLDNKIDKLDRKVEKGDRDILKYIEQLDNDLQEHRHNSESHLKVPSL